MAARTEGSRLWPYTVPAAIVAVPLIWLSLGLSMLVAHRYFESALSLSDHTVLLAVLTLSVLPLTLALIDYLALRGAVIGNEWLKVDFSKTVVESGTVRRDTPGLPDNILSTAEAIQDSGGVKWLPPSANPR